MEYMLFRYGPFVENHVYEYDTYMDFKFLKYGPFMELMLC